MRLRPRLYNIWMSRWWIISASLVVLLLVREWSPPSYRIVDGNVPVMDKIVRRGDPLSIKLSRCNDTSRTAIFHYIRRLYRDGGADEIWPLQEGNAPVDPGCRTSWIEVGEVPMHLPLGNWHIRSENTSVNWLWKPTISRWVSDSFEVVGPTGGI
jgi:hypothetical protein